MIRKLMIKCLVWISGVAFVSALYLDGLSSETIRWMVQQLGISVKKTIEAGKELDQLSKKLAKTMRESD